MVHLKRLLQSNPSIRVSFAAGMAPSSRPKNSVLGGDLAITSSEEPVVIVAPCIISWVPTSKHLASTFSMPIVALPPRVATPLVPLTLVIIGSYKGKAPLQHHLGSNIDVTHSREGDKHAPPNWYRCRSLYPIQLLHSLGVVLSNAPSMGCGGAKRSFTGWCHYWAPPNASQDKFALHFPLFFSRSQSIWFN